jgi:hypothetical protein
VVLILRSARAEEIPQNRNKRARVSKEEEATAWPSCFETAASPPPQHEGEESAQNDADVAMTFTIARVACLAKPGLCKFPVFVLFRPVIDGQSGWPTRRRSRAFLVFILQLTGRRAAPGCSRPPVFLL